LIPEIKERIQKVKPSKNTAVHYGVRCDGCGVKPIVGSRYKCSISHDFDFCEKCEETIEHPYAFLKIKRPEQAPKILITSLVDDYIPGLDVNGLTFAQENLETLFKKPEPKIEEVVKIEIPIPEVKTINEKEIEI